MEYLAVLTPVVLLLLMVLLGRLEHWLTESTPEVAQPQRRRWRRPPHGVRSPAAVEVGAGRRLLVRRTRAAVRRRPAAAVPRASVAVPGAARRRLLGGRLRSGR